MLSIECVLQFLEIFHLRNLYLLKAFFIETSTLRYGQCYTLSKKPRVTSCETNMLTTCLWIQWQSQTSRGKRHSWKRGRGCCHCSRCAPGPDFPAGCWSMGRWSYPPHRCAGSHSWAPCWNWEDTKENLGHKRLMPDSHYRVNQKHTVLARIFPFHIFPFTLSFLATMARPARLSLAWPWIRHVGAVCTVRSVCFDFSHGSQCNSCGYIHS